MDHADHVRLIQDGVTGAGPRWLELGAGEGAFTLALADVLGPGGRILVTDRDERALGAAAAAVRRSFPQVEIETRAFDYTDAIPDGRFDGVLAANTLHFVADRHPTLLAIGASIATGGRLVIVEYDTDRGNRWVPRPFSFESWRTEAVRAGFAEPRLTGRVPSRFLGAIYAAVAEVDHGPSVRPGPTASRPDEP